MRRESQHAFDEKQSEQKQTMLTQACFYASYLRLERFRQRSHALDDLIREKLERGHDGPKSNCKMLPRTTVL